MASHAEPSSSPKLHAALRGLLALHDFEAAARRRLPRPIFGYIAGAAEDNASLRDNRSVFEEYAFSTRVLRDVSQRSQAVELFGQRYSSPFGIAPMGIAALSSYRGDLALARAARQAGIVSIMSGTSLVRMEEVAQESPGTWFQAYIPGDQARIDALVDRVSRAGFGTLVVTVDIPVSANRENNLRTGFSTPLRPSLRLAWDGLVRPRWVAGTFLRTLLRHGMPHFENSFATRGSPILSSTVLRDFSARDHLSWAHIEAIRQRWKGRLVIKGLLSVEDALQARGIGADGIVLSNHGGRQLDGAASPMRVLEAVVAAVGPGYPVLIDSGFRRGSDVLKALALGARMVLVGRPFNYAAAVAGEAGIAHAIGLLRDEVDRNLAMLGVTSCAELGPRHIVRRRL
ncbi:alpha-hydroxy-acid oxidizing enzyme [Paracidovorax avenae]|uniref:alpha-hydroxy acid oxidase n=1 Tax=Paracidovorax avenae TaxID=80867 RepID=UPI000D156FEE|nr:alpha-hydroxy acid oxidase [Paracidovorax avenae]AVS92547.1 alpha-hydroxy-acid oxidizing enzyme [Paracidovorax avenae]AVS97787.1 alpha-hydroxy-acid oxidizing enzyme [Paracidovorax avenae]AVT04828.1 alpha-hydroxy-acid oxidizing enzyme [Paracidovorax avenae]AVT18975.1 alpha-hydroxy-acid oxidizing enzyme [Paracidovorax avenae]